MTDSLLAFSLEHFRQIGRLHAGAFRHFHQSFGRAHGGFPQSLSREVGSDFLEDLCVMPRHLLHIRLLHIWNLKTLCKNCKVSGFARSVIAWAASGRKTAGPCYLGGFVTAATSA